MPIFNVVCCICGGPVEDTWDISANNWQNATGIKMYECARCDHAVAGIAPADYKPNAYDPVAALQSMLSRYGEEE
jgi:hypothetical protein